MEIVKWLHSMLGGTSPKTGYAGSITIILSVLGLFQEHVTEGGIPTNYLQWIALVLGIGARLAKDADKTNSQHPLAVSVSTPEVSKSPVTVITQAGEFIPMQVLADGEVIPLGPTGQPIMPSPLAPFPTTPARTSPLRATPLAPGEKPSAVVLPNPNKGEPNG